MSWIYWVYVYFYTQIALQRNQDSDISQETFYISTHFYLAQILYKPHHCQILADPFRSENIQFNSGDRCYLGMKGENYQI